MDYGAAMSIMSLSFGMLGFVILGLASLSTCSADQAAEPSITTALTIEANRPLGRLATE
jgi:hypothetical protein